MIRDTLKAEHSKRSTMRLAEKIQGDRKHIRELVVLLEGKDELLSQRAAWLLHYLAMPGDLFMVPWYPQMVSLLKRTEKHAAVRRNILSFFQVAPLPEKFQGELFELCTRFILSGSEPVAVRAFAMTVAGRIALDHEGLRPELRMMLCPMTTSESPGLRSRSKKVLKMMGKE